MDTSDNTAQSSDVVVNGTNLEVGMDPQENPQVLDEHRNRVTVGTDSENGQVNLAFENDGDDDNRINDNYYNTEQHAHVLQNANNGDTEIAIPNDSLINMHNGRSKNRKSKEFEKIPMDDMQENEQKYPTKNENGSSNQNNNGSPVSNENYPKNDPNTDKHFKEYFIPVTSHKKFLRGEKLYLQKCKGRSSGWKKCIICGIIATFLAIAILIAILLATGLIVLKSEDQAGSKKNGTDKVTSAASEGGEGVGSIIPVDSTTTTTTTTSTTTTTTTSTTTTTGIPIFLDRPHNEITFPPYSYETTESPDASPSPTTGSLENAPLATEPVTDEDAKNAVSGQIRLTSIEFDDNLSNNSSVEYQNLANSIQEELLSALGKNNSRVKSVKILGFSPGSVKVHYVIVYEDDEEGADETQDTARALNDYIHDKGGIAGYQVDMDSIALEKVKNECLENNGYCTHYCSWDLQKLERTCSCPDGFYLESDGMTCLESEVTAAPEPTSEPEYGVYIESTPEPVAYNETEASPEPTSEPEPASEPEPTSEPEPVSYNETESTPEPEVGIWPASYNDSDATPEPSSEPEPSAYNETESTPEPQSELFPTYVNDTEATPESTSEPEPSSNNETTSVDPWLEYLNKLETTAEPTSEPEATAYNDTEATPEPGYFNDTDTYAEPEPTIEPEPRSNNETISDTWPVAYNGSEPTSEPEATAYNETTMDTWPVAYNSSEPTSEPEPSAYNETTTDTWPIAYNSSEPTSEPEPHSAMNTTEDDATDECLQNNGYCTHICTWNAEERQSTCSCPEDLVLHSDGMTCIIFAGNDSESTNETYAVLEPSILPAQNDTANVTDGCLDNNGYCTHDCIWDADKLQVNCSCPDYLVLHSDGMTCIIYSATDLNEANETSAAVVPEPTVSSNYTADDVLNECLDNNGYCSHNCTWDSENLKRVCTCPEELILHSDGMTCIEPLEEKLINEIPGLNGTLFNIVNLNNTTTNETEPEMSVFLSMENGTIFTNDIDRSTTEEPSTTEDPQDEAEIFNIFAFNGTVNATEDLMLNQSEPTDQPQIFNTTELELKFDKSNETEIESTTMEMELTTEEVTTSYVPVLLPNEVSCTNSQYKCDKIGDKGISCIRKSFHCDGIHDCEDGSDEVFCGNCTGGTLPCRDGSNCLTPSQICDAKFDCLDNADEINCFKPDDCENKGGFQCSNGICLPGTSKCNGFSDCPNGEDEQSCSCSSQEFQCSNGQCIPWSNKCDGQWQCSDFSDEQGCVSVESRSNIVKIFNSQSGWMPLCSDSWTLEDGHAVCQDLGYSHAKEIGAEFLPHDEDWAIKYQDFKSGVHSSVVSSVNCKKALGATLQCAIQECSGSSSTEDAPNWEFVMTLSNDVSAKSCYGVAISPMWIITSKTCLDERKWHSSPSWTARASQGYSDIQQIDRFFFHPHADSWRSRGLFQANDLALAKLKRPINDVNVACVTNMEVSAHDECYSGFSNGARFVTEKMQLVDMETCNDSMHYNGRVSESIICAKAKDSNTNNCFQKGDAPLLMCKQDGHWRFAGLMSYQRQCDAYNTQPRIFSNMAAMTEYFESIIGRQFAQPDNSMADKESNENENLNDIYHNDHTEADDVTTHHKETIDQIYNGLENSLDALKLLINKADVDDDMSDGQNVTDDLILAAPNATEIMPLRDLSANSSSNISLVNATDSSVELISESSDQKITSDNQICNDGLFQCEDMTQCIDMASVCNGKEDCADGSDEAFCLRIHPEATVLEARKSGESTQSEMHPRELWMPICADNWSEKYSQAACRQMGYSGLLSIESKSTSALKQNRPSQKFMALKNNSNISEAINFHSLITEVDECQSRSYSVLTCQTERCGAWSLDFQPVGRTIGGNPAQDGQWPSVAMIRSKVENGTVCTASVVGKKWVLTAASCLQRLSLDAKNWVFQAGPNDPSVNIDKIVVHPENVAANFTHYDIAMLQLADFLDASSKVHSICVAHVPLEDRQLCVTASWTRNEETNEVMLEYLPVPIVPMNECNSSKFYNGQISQDMVCAGFTDRPRTVCEGDEGAPLMCLNSRELWVLHGALLKDNVRTGCGDENIPSIYTNIYESQHWIAKTTSYTNINSLS